MARRIVVFPDPFGPMMPVSQDGAAAITKGDSLEPHYSVVWLLAPVHEDSAFKI